MSDRDSLHRACILAIIACTAPTLITQARGQDTRILLIRPVDAKALPPEVARTFRLALTESARGVAFVPSVAEATDLIELTSYEWTLDGTTGVREIWRFSHLPLLAQDEGSASRARPLNILVVVEGGTLAESTRAGAERLREVLRPLLARFQRVVPK
jgi:hypothetical protein